jgi:hypothetical protein
MKKLKKILTSSLIITIVIICLSIILEGCEDANGKQVAGIVDKKTIVNNGGKTITFPKDDSGLQEFAVTTVEKGSATMSVIAPARVVASISISKTEPGKIILFDSPDVTSLYSQYKQSKANAELTSKNLIRIKQMYENLGVTAKDLNQAETDAATAKASFEEMTGRLKVLSFNPEALNKIKNNTVWLIADVPEDQLHELKKDEPVKISFASYPGKVFIGRTDAVGDIVDPVTHEVKVRLSLLNPDGKILPGMFAQSDFGNKINSVYVLPLTSVVTVEGRNYVFVQTGLNIFERRQIVLANSDADKLVVLTGINTGEKVVTSGSMLLKGLSFGY